MQEYFGDSAKKYLQPSDKFFTLFPALERLIPKAKGDQTLIDLACGTGDLYKFVKSKGYSYIGIDISEDMLNRARFAQPEGKFIQSDVTVSIKKHVDVADIILCNMLFPSISSKKAFGSVFKTMNQVLKHDGTIYLSAGHPCFDGYMGKKFFAREDIETNYQGYFSSGHNYQVHRKFENNDFVFNDHHWTLSDYLHEAKINNLYLSDIDECELTKDAPQDIVDKVCRKGTPSFIVFAFKRVKNE